MILWRTFKYVDYDINFRVFVDMHDVYPEGEFTNARLEKIEKIFVKSKFHRSLFPNVPEDKFAIIPNGIEYDKFFETAKDPFLVINTSSPDRSLSAYIDIAEKVKKEIPEARFVWAYGWTVFDHAHETNPTVMEWKEKQIKRMEEVGVENLGRLSHDQIKDLYLNASIFLYPTEFAEIDCISLTKAIAAGCHPVTTDFAALGEKAVSNQTHSDKTKDDWAGPYQYDFALHDEEKKEEMASEVIKALKGATLKTNREWATQYDWGNITDQWLKILEKN